MMATFLHGLELGIALGVALVAIPTNAKLRLLHFEGLVLPRRKAGAR
jgi:hypothetical protein